jgi:hypothetical protein
MAKVPVATELNLRHPTIDEQLDAGDEAGVVGRQEQCGLGDFIGLAHAPHRYQGDELRDGLLRQRRENRRVDGAGADHIGTDLLRLIE